MYGLVDIRQVVPIKIRKRQQRTRCRGDFPKDIIFKGSEFVVLHSIWSNMREKVRYKYRGGFILPRA